jgi:hypothetical protein
MVTIPCGRRYDTPGQVRQGWGYPARYGEVCADGELCPWCTALRGLLAACEKLIERGGAGEDERNFKPWDDAVAEAEAAIAAVRSAGQTRGEK